MSIAAVADTHAAIWYLYADPRISSTAAAFIEEAANAGDNIVISTISLVEVVYLAERGRIPQSVFSDLVRCFSDPDHVFKEAPLSIAVADSVHHISRAEVPDMPDRIVVATALHFDVPIISRDRLIRSSNAKTLW